MSELRRILSDRRRLALLLALPVLCCGFFLLERMGGELRGGLGYLRMEAETYRANVPRFAAMTAAEAAAAEGEVYWFDEAGSSTLRSTKLHVEGYADYLAGVQAQARRMSTSSVFGRDKTSFTYRSIQKTAADFQTLEGIEVTFGGNRALETWIGFRGGDVLFLLVILALVLAFFEDKRRGLLPLVRACPRGRRALAAERLGILLLVSCLLTGLLCGSVLVLAFALYGGTETLGHTIQSVEGFRTCTLHLTVGQWICLYLGAKALCGFLLGLLFWFVLSFLSQLQLAWLVLLAILGAEYAAWTLIPPQMALGVLRYVNLFAFVFPAESLRAYGNVNLFGWPVGTLALLTWLYVMLTVLLSGWVLFGSVRRRPLGGRDLLGRPVSVWNRAMDVLRCRFPLGVMEAYKLLILSGTALFLVAGIWYAPRLRSFGYSFGAAEDAAYNGYLREAAGPIGADTDAYLARARASLTEDWGDLSVYEAALDRLEAEVAGLRAQAAAGGYAPWLTEQARINNVLGPDAAPIHRWSALAALLLLLLVSAPVFALERRAGTETLLRTSRRGRSSVLWRKYAVVWLEAAAVWALVYLRQWDVTLDYLGAASLDAPVQNIALLAATPLPVTLRTLLGLIFALRLGALLICGTLIAWLSARCRSWEQTVLAGVGLLLLPGAAVYFDRAWAGWISVLPMLTGTELALPGQGQTGRIIVALGWLGLAAFLTRRVRQRWVFG